MFCIVCGKEMKGVANLCLNCGCEQKAENVYGKEKFCANCGWRCHPNAVICVRCGCGWSADTPAMVGVNQAVTHSETTRRSKYTPLEAAIASSVVPGAGQYIIGRMARGIWIFVFFFVGALAIWTVPLLYFLVFFWWLVQVADAYIQAGKIGEEHPA